VKDTPAPEVRVIEAYEPFEEVSVDFMTKLPKDEAGNVNILVVVDNFTKFVELFPVPDLLAETTAACLLQVFSRYGPIRRIRSDRGSQFTGSLCSKLCELAGCQQVLTVGYRPEANGIVERVNAEVKRHLQVLVNVRQVQNRWSVCLPLVQRILNSTVQASTGFAPAEMVYGGLVSLDRGILGESTSGAELKDCDAYVKELRRVQEELVSVAQLRLAKVRDKRVTVEDKVMEKGFKEFKVGDLVIAPKTGGSKLDFRWKGPFRVAEKLGSTRYGCSDLRTGELHQFDVSSLRLFECPDDVDPLEVAAMDEGEYVVDCILNHRLEGTKKKNRTHYYFLVKFQDGGEEWIPYMEVRDLEVFTDYLRNHPDLARVLRLDVP
jgi:hypothetical protein